MLTISRRLADARSAQESNLAVEPDPTRCRGCGSWITLHRLDTQGCPVCRTLAARNAAP